MLKQAADASGPAVLIAWLVNQVVPVASPVIIFIGAVMGVVWYGIRFFEYFKHGRLGD